MISTTLAATAFGADPGCWPLPAARNADELLLRAVAAGGQGRYSSAHADLAELLRAEPRGRRISLAMSTRASFHRQLGWHAQARGWDGRALALAGQDPESGVDALIGLAADALGLGRLAASAALLNRADGLMEAAGSLAPRLAIRLAWVGSELAMAAGEGADALNHAERARELAAQARPALCRHRVKSEVVLAAALCSSGDLAGSRAVADAALADTQSHGLVPLRWALACLLADIGSSTHAGAEVVEIRDLSATFITRHGGRLSSR
ncbi:MAG: hypothetical protein QNL98_00080 [Mycobacterium sp.]